MWTIEFEYRETEFECETCGYWLHRVVPTNLLTCTNSACSCDEPLFLVEGS